MTKNTKIPKVVGNNKKKIEPSFLPEDKAWEWQYFLVPELIAEISSMLTVRNQKRFQFYTDLKKFIKTWKKENK